MSFWSDLVKKFTPGQGEEIDWEALLIEADLGLPLTLRLVEGLEERGLETSVEEGQAFLRGELIKLIESPRPDPVLDKPEVILMIGVNGSGKTTTTAKLAFQAMANNQKVVMGAADTFRAAAVEQLQRWGERLGCEVIAGEHGTDPASVAYRAFEAARQQDADLLLVDTAGRQANKHNLMQELAKVKRTLTKLDPNAPHRTWLVVDAATGGGILHQAQEFHKAVTLDGLILTKLDGSAKGGAVAAVREELGLPVLYTGHGEQPEDLRRFDAEAFVQTFFGPE